MFSSLTNCDPGDIQNTISKLIDLKVQVNVVSLSAGIYILESMSQQTAGQFCLAKNKLHLDDLMDRFLVPSESTSSTASTFGIVESAIESEEGKDA